MTPIEAYTILAANWSQLPQGKHDFAKNLIKGYSKYGSWTEKQQPYALQMAEALAPKLPGTTPAAAPVQRDTSIKVGDLTAVHTMFDKAAASGLKKPGIVFDLHGFGIRVRKALKAGSKFEGGYHLVRSDNKTYIGSVTSDGRLVVALSAKNTLPGAVLEWIPAAMEEFASDPVGFTAAQGKKTGACRYCMHPLTDARSTQVGYGPICAKNWGLPW